MLIHSQITCNVVKKLERLLVIVTSSNHVDGIIISTDDWTDELHVRQYKQSIFNQSISKHSFNKTSAMREKLTT